MLPLHMLLIDGSTGEGGGQILRTALGLSLATGQEFRIQNIRAKRKNPGLQAQHLASVRAAAAIGSAQITGAELHSQELHFTPALVQPGDYSFDIGTAGSAALVLQTVLPALITAPSPSALILEGGTHNPLAPPFEFLAKTFLPLLERIGPKVRLKLDRHGFYPAGGGKIRAQIEPAKNLASLELLERGKIVRCRGIAVIAHLPSHVAERELKVLKRDLRLDSSDLEIQEVKSRGPGNALIVELESPNLTEVLVGFGEQGVKAEVVAGRLAKEVQVYRDANVPVGEHLADQLLVPMALAGAGTFVTSPLSPHALTNIETIRRFLPVEIKVKTVSDQAVRVEIERTS